MFSLLEYLPVELVGVKVLDFLSLREIIMLERASCSKECYQHFLDLIPLCQSLELPTDTHKTKSVLAWFAKRRCKINCINIRIPGKNPVLYMKDLQVGYFELEIEEAQTKMCRLKPFLEHNESFNIKRLCVRYDQNRKVMERLSKCTANVKHLTIQDSSNCMDWLTADILRKWKLKEVNLTESGITPRLVSLIVQTCLELTSIKLLESDNIDDSTVLVIVQHCPKLETLIIPLRNINLTWSSLLALSERGLPLEELAIGAIPIIPTPDIARRCSHALSRIRCTNLYSLHVKGHQADIIIPYLTGLTCVELDCYPDIYLPLLIQHCHKLTQISVYEIDFPIQGLLSLCRPNPLIKDVCCYEHCGFTDTALIELIHICPHLHTLWLPEETDITDIGILALSEHCPQLQQLEINACHKVTETAVLQLLQRCRKLTKLEVSTSSLSEKTWALLDSNKQKFVSRGEKTYSDLEDM